MILGGTGSYYSWGKWFPSFLGEVVLASGQPPKPVSNEMMVVARYKQRWSSDHMRTDLLAADRVEGPSGEEWRISDLRKLLARWHPKNCQSEQ